MCYDVCYLLCHTLNERTKLFQESIIQWYAIVNAHKYTATGFIDDEKEVYMELGI